MPLRWCSRRRSTSRRSRSKRPRECARSLTLTELDMQSGGASLSLLSCSLRPSPSATIDWRFRRSTLRFQRGRRPRKETVTVGESMKKPQHQPGGEPVRQTGSSWTSRRSLRSSLASKEPAAPSMRRSTSPVRSLTGVLGRGSPEEGRVLDARVRHAALRSQRRPGDRRRRSADHARHRQRRGRRGHRSPAMRRFTASSWATLAA